MPSRQPPLLARARARIRARAAARRSGRPPGRWRRSLPPRKAVPSLITLIGLCAGLTAIRFAIEGRFDFAVAAIGAAALMDALDGRMARLLGASSPFGAELDSLADFVDFGVAPALVLYLWGLGSVASIGWIVALVFALAAALRLARFNVAAAEAPRVRGYFTGVPTPAAALLVLLPLYLEGLGLVTRPFWPPLVMTWMVTVAALMVSRLPTFSGAALAGVKREDRPRLAVGGVALAALLVTYPYAMLTALAAAYLFSLPASARLARARPEPG